MLFIISIGLGLYARSLIVFTMAFSASFSGFFFVMAVGPLLGGLVGLVGSCVM